MQSFYALGDQLDIALYDDPSYGVGSYDSLQNWENASISGYQVQYIRNNTRYHLCKENDPNKLEVQFVPRK